MPKSQTLDQILAALEKAGTAQNRKVYAKHGACEPMFGVSFAELKKLTKTVGTDKDLAQGLWDSGNHDARILACMVDDPQAISSSELNRRAGQLQDYIICDALAKLVINTPHAAAKAALWKERKGEYVSACGWELVGLIAFDAESALTDAEGRKLMDQIVKEIHSRPNRVRHAMNQALICLGVRNAALHKKALTAAKKIGKVEVDHGATSCKTPDAAAYMAKTLAHQAKKSAKPRKSGTKKGK